jgi:hypothetical protein
VSTLSNVQNSLFLPDLGNLYNRLPLIDLSRRKGRRKQSDPAPAAAAAARRYADGQQHVSAFAPAGEPAPGGLSPVREDARPWIETESVAETTSAGGTPRVPPATSDAALTRRASGASSSSSESSVSADEADMRRRERLMRSRSTIRGEYAVLPPGLAWDDWSDEERAELDDHVRHLMHSKRERVRRRLRGFFKFASRRACLLRAARADDAEAAQRSGSSSRSTRSSSRSGARRGSSSLSVGASGVCGTRLALMCVRSRLDWTRRPQGVLYQHRG